MIIIFPLAGLCNRMRVIDSAITLANKIQKPLKIVWALDDGLNCEFRNLFTDIDGLEIIDGYIPLKYQVPSKRNLFLPSIYKRLFIDKILWPRDIALLLNNKSNFEFLKDYNRTLIYSYEGIYESNKVYNYFRPIESIKKQIDDISQSFNRSTFGIHIRRTDNERSIENSPVELFIEAIEQELKLCPDSKFFLATDCIDTKQRLINLFGDCIITRQIKLERNSKAGIQSALVDLYLLSRTKKIYGSFWSTFSETAANLSKIPITYLTKNLNV